MPNSLKVPKTPKPEGWLSVPPRSGNYPETAFAAQIKGHALDPAFPLNSWIILDAAAPSAIIQIAVHCSSHRHLLSVTAS